MEEGKRKEGTRRGSGREEEETSQIFGRLSSVNPWEENLVSLLSMLPRS